MQGRSPPRGQQADGHSTWHGRKRRCAHHQRPGGRRRAPRRRGGSSSKDGQSRSWSGAPCPTRVVRTSGVAAQPDDVHDWVNWFSVASRALNVHHVVYRRAGGSDEWKNLELRRTACHQQHHAGDHRRGQCQPSRPA
ncbi:HNH endonuclease [Streptomyces davaonensis]|uniref:HNH endonuclease n=1 Tax=Streptomyces davaonensis TaxID=348043 RepID=UPI000997AB70